MQLDEILNIRRKSHIAGGILLSISLLFVVFAVTVFTIQNMEE